MPKPIRIKAAKVATQAPALPKAKLRRLGAKR